MRPITFLVVVLAVAPLPSVTAQEDPFRPRRTVQRLKPGDRVRVTAADLNIREFEGRLRRLHNDTVVVRPEYGGAPPVVIPLASLTRLEVRRVRGNFWAGAGIGMLAGGLIGGVIGSTQEVSFCFLPYPEQCPTTPGTGLGVMIGAAGGFVLGGVVGAGIRSDRWRALPLNDLRMTLGPRRDAIRLTVSAAF